MRTQSPSTQLPSIADAHPTPQQAQRALPQARQQPSPDEEDGDDEQDRNRLEREVKREKATTPQSHPPPPPPQQQQQVLTPSSSSSTLLPPGIRCPVLPPLIPPFRYCLVEHGLYRGAYPSLKNMRFMYRLKLRMIISLVPERDGLPTVDLSAFCTAQSISHVLLQVDKYDDGFSHTDELVASILSLMINPANHPLFIHCRDGAHNTGIVVMCLRRLQNWSLQPIYDEFVRYTKSNSISFQEKQFVEAFHVTVSIPRRIPSWLWNGVRRRKHPCIQLFLVPPSPCAGGDDNGESECERMNSHGYVQGQSGNNNSIDVIGTSNPPSKCNSPVVNEHNNNVMASNHMQHNNYPLASTSPSTPLPPSSSSPHLHHHRHQPPHLHSASPPPHAHSDSSHPRPTDRDAPPPLATTTSLDAAHPIPISISIPIPIPTPITMSNNNNNRTTIPPRTHKDVPSPAHTTGNDHASPLTLPPPPPTTSTKKIGGVTNGTVGLRPSHEHEQHVHVRVDGYCSTLAALDVHGVEFVPTERQEEDEQWYGVRKR